MPPLDNTTIILLIVIGVIFACLLFAGVIRKLSLFIEQLRYINMEIQRNSGEDRDFWIRKKRRLWRIFLPFYGK